MKKLFPFFTFFILTALEFTQAQTCLIIRDSIIAGSRATSFSDYIYGANNRLEQVTHTDSASLIVTTSDLVLFDGNGNVSEIRTFNTVGTSTIIRTIKYTYTSGKISRVEVTAVNGGGAWAMAHDITYNGSNIASMILDPSFTVGTPEGIEGSFIDFVWAGGNISTLSIVVDSDTFEIAVVADNKNNVFKKLLNTEGATFLFQAAMQNNMISAAFVNDEPAIGQLAGTKILDRVYSYNSDNDVETLTDNATVLNPDSKTTQYIYDCSVGIRAPLAITSVSVFPNPAQNRVSLEEGKFAGDVKILDMTGKQVFFQRVETEVASLDISWLMNGIYSIEMINQGKIFRGKLVVNK